MYNNPAGITGNNLYPWQYTLLDAGNKESVLYAGFVNADQLLACTDGTNYVNSDSAVLQSWVTPPQYTKQSLYIAPVEFYANGLMSWKVDANNQWQRSYKVLDHLGNVRVEGIGWANEYRADYRPFGGTEWTNSNINSKTSYRLGFLGLQKDKESNLGDHGVRKYDSEIGRFLAIDPLWEKYNTLNPYQYSGNSPVMMADWNGGFTEWAHNHILRTVFGERCAVYQNASRDVDKDQDNQYKHGLANIGQSPEAAKIQSKNFISDRLYASVVANDGTSSDYALGEGMHTLMDIASPEHANFKEYKGVGGFDEGMQQFGLIVAYPDLLTKYNAAYKLAYSLKHGAFESLVSDETMNVLNKTLSSYSMKAYELRNKFRNKQITESELKVAIGRFTETIVNSEVDMLDR